MTTARFCSHTNLILKELWEQEAYRVRHWIHRQMSSLQNTVEADDILNDTFLVIGMLVLRRIELATDPNHWQEQRAWLRAMLYRIARFRICYLRRRCHKLVTNQSTFEAFPADDPSFEASGDPLDHILAVCTPDEKELLLDRLAGLSYAEISERTGLTIECLRTRWRRLKAKLKAVFC